MSLVLIIISLVILIVFPALKAVRDGTQRAATASHMNTVLRAAAGFVQAHGCLPCPAPTTSNASGFGRVRGEASGPMCGSCAIAEGLVPYVSLGLPASMARDGWGRWLTFRIDPDLAIAFGIVPPTLPCTASDPAPCALGASQKGLCRAGMPTANRIQIQIPRTGTSQQAAMVIVSHGPNGFGSYRTTAQNPAYTNAHPIYGGPAGACTNTSGFELCNADDNASFMAAETTEDKAAPFDDALLYVGRNALVSLLGNGACQTAWE